VLKSWLCRRRGFTLIELLVVIAIIGILAAMLFPVFARARESARKTQCLANVKNIAMGIQIYLTDYDRFPPDESNAAAIADWERWFTEDRGCHRDYRATWGNPYLRWPVIFDEYTKSREVWKCPSAKWDPSGCWIIPSYHGGYLQYLDDTHGSGWTVFGYSDGGTPCNWSFPSGWGGTVTDSIGQQIASAGPSQGAFSATIGCTSTMLTNASTASIDDASKCVVCGDGTTFGAILQGSGSILYEECGTCGKADWVNCTWTANNACHTLDVNLATKWETDPGYRATFTRHMGGSNVGFADGHAKWWMADALVTAAPVCQDNCPDSCPFVTTDKLGGLCP